MSQLDDTSQLTFEVSDGVAPIQLHRAALPATDKRLSRSSFRHGRRAASRATAGWRPSRRRRRGRRLLRDVKLPAELIRVMVVLSAHEVGHISVNGNLASCKGRPRRFCEDDGPGLPRRSQKVCPVKRPSTIRRPLMYAFVRRVSAEAYSSYIRQMMDWIAKLLKSLARPTGLEPVFPP